MTITPQERAERSAAAMWQIDQATQWLGMTLDRIGPGRAEMSFEVEAHHCNGNLICHGGIIFTLADNAFAYACNSYNQVTVAHQNSITFCAPGRRGDRLTATAIEVVRNGRSGVYDVKVTNQDGTLIAVMRGNSRTIKGQNFQEIHENEEEIDG